MKETITRAILGPKISNGAEKVRATRVNICGTGHHQAAFPLGDNVSVPNYSITARGSFLTMHLLSLEGGHGGNSRPNRPQQPERLRCMICRRVSTRAEAEYRRWYCTGGHMGQWQLVVIILSLYETNDWIPLCPITVGLHNTTKITTSPVNVFTVLTWRICIPRAARQVEFAV
jgi:hypothetical protein